MLKIIEAYSNKVVADVHISFSAIKEKVSNSGSIYLSKIPIGNQNFTLQTRLYDSEEHIQKRILQFKIDNLNCKNPSNILIVRHNTKHLACRYIKNPKATAVNLESVKVNYLLYYKDLQKVKINKKLYEKMNLVYTTLIKIDLKEIGPIANIAFDIIKSYESTGIVTERDLKWLNGVYNKYKRIVKLYE